jgi:hypothetical protein
MSFTERGDRWGLDEDELAEQRSIARSAMRGLRIGSETSRHRMRGEVMIVSAVMPQVERLVRR